MWGWGRPPSQRRRLGQRDAVREDRLLDGSDLAMLSNRTAANTTGGGGPQPRGALGAASSRFTWRACASQTQRKPMRSTIGCMRQPRVAPGMPPPPSAPAAPC